MRYTVVSATTSSIPPPTYLTEAQVTEQLATLATNLGNESKRLTKKTGLDSELKRCYDDTASFAKSAKGGKSALVQTTNCWSKVADSRDKVLKHHRYGPTTVNRTELNTEVDSVAALAAIRLAFDERPAGASYKLTGVDPERYWKQKGSSEFCTI